MQSLAIVSLLATAVYAQTNPLIPQGISSGCATFMSTLDSDPQILSCTTAFSNAVSTFGVGANPGTVTTSTITSTLNTLSSSLSACSESVIRSKLTDFYTACSNELTSSPNPDVIRAYDVLYVHFPFSQAVCTKDDSGNYCVLEVGSTLNLTNTLLSTAGSAGTDPANDLWVPITSDNQRRAQEQVIIPNVQQFKALNLVFLALQPSLAAAQLCTPCTRNIFNQYIQFMSDISYAPGIGNSPLMGGETDLYNAIQQKCGAAFLSGSVQAAGGISNGLINGGAAGISVNARTVAGALFATVAGLFITL
ncbi:hypothetical protein BJ322DRAFT_1064889 [Thelephora terrestris]|uniref:DUF7729 domain-containing protein n=1 Tax=Thelephora terrestris TaxID=56493 RepID=A0A9P6HFW1_9AGAM|nr:hypothetical protein BJ322DRAFT_1064889 [Thelephora terrestris]